MIPTPIEARDLAEQLLEPEEGHDEEPAPVGQDCGKFDCYKFRHCWACIEWLGCKRKPLGDCFRCDRRSCPLEGGGSPC